MDTTIFSDIKETAKKIIPSNGHVILFGSQARGDSHKGSDWDLLILIDKSRIEESDHDKYTYPFWELGWKIDAMIHPIIYTVSDWKNKKSVFRSTNSVRYAVSDSGDMRSLVFQVFLRLQS